MTDLAASVQTSVTAGDAMAAAGGTVSDYFALLKPRVMVLVVFTSLAGLMVAPGMLHPVLAMVAVLCIGISAGAAGALNMWYERDIDRLMDRTRGRPLPAGRIAPDEALAFGVILSVAPILLMGLALNWVAAALLALANGFYVFVYTMWLKRRTPQNIVIGGAAGAFPPMIGWAAVTGDVSLGGIALFLLIFIWTPPHFWALALYACRDYARAGVPMLPVVAGERETRRQILLYSLPLLPLGCTPWLLNFAGPAYLATALLAGSLFVLCAVQVWREAEGQYRAARRLFGFSILHLFLLFAVLIGERLLAA